MAGLIPQQFIDDLLDRTDIVEIIDGRVALRKSGQNYSGLCPFHNEKSPSFTVSQTKQFYHCFGCGANGNAIGFLMEFERMEFPVAVETLARAAGIEVPVERQANPEKKKQKDSLYDQLERAQQFFTQQLRQHPTREKAVNYLKGRQLTGETAKKFVIGYAPPGWENLHKELVKSEKDEQQLIEAGLLIKREDRDGCYDRFRDRIIFPIRDNRGRTIAFGGRVLGDDKPKYLNSPGIASFSQGQRALRSLRGTSGQQSSQPLPYRRRLYGRGSTGATRYPLCRCDTGHLHQRYSSEQAVPHGIRNRYLF